MRKFGLILAFLCFALTAHAQAPTLYSWQDTIQNTLGQANPNAVVIVLSGTVVGAQAVNTTTQPGTPLASIYADPYGATPINQTTSPLTTAAGNGQFQFWAATGYYVVQVFGSGINGQLVYGISLGATATGAVITATSGQVLYANGTNSAVSSAALAFNASTGVLSASSIASNSINNVLYLGNVYPCSDVGMNAAIAALGTIGGTVDGSACTSYSMPGGMNIEAPVIVGANTGTLSHGVKLILPCTSTPWVVTPTVTGRHVFEIADQSELAGCSLRASEIAVSNSGTPNMLDVISFLPNPGNLNLTEYGKVSNVWIENDNAASTVTNGLLNLTGAYDSVINDVKLVGYAPSAGTGTAGCLFYAGDAAGNVGANADDVSNMLLEGLYYTGTQLMCIHPTHGAYIGPIHFHGGDWSHPGPGKNSVKIDQVNTTHSYGISFTDIYLETNNADTTTATFSVSDTLSPSFNNIYISRLDASSTAPCLYFNDTGSGATDNISIKNLSCVGGTTPNAVLSNIAGIPNLAVNLVPGLFAPGIGGLGLTSFSYMAGLSNLGFVSAGGGATTFSPALSASNFTVSVPPVSGTLSYATIASCGTASACTSNILLGKGLTVNGTITFSSSTTASVTGISPAFTAATSYGCTFYDASNAYTFHNATQTTTGFTVTASTSNSDTVAWTCGGY